MQKLNNFGQQVRDLKLELDKPYPQITHNALLSVANGYLKDKFITEDIFEAFSQKIDIKDFETLVLECDNCRKSKSQLETEFKAIRDQLIEKIFSDLSLVPIDTTFEIDTEKETVSIKKDFLITDEFIKNYFYIPTEEDFESLMKRKGFIEKFSILRLEKIFNDFLEKVKDIEDYDISHTNVFFNSDTRNYGIQLDLEISIDNLEDENSLNTIGDSVQEVLNRVEEHYNITMFG